MWMRCGIQGEPNMPAWTFSGSVVGVIEADDRGGLVSKNWGVSERKDSCSHPRFQPQPFPLILFLQRLATPPFSSFLVKEALEERKKLRMTEYKARGDCGGGREHRVSGIAEQSFIYRTYTRPLPKAALPHSVLSYSALPCPGLPFPILPYPTLSCPTLPYPALPRPSLSKGKGDEFVATPIASWLSIQRRTFVTDKNNMLTPATF